MIVVDASALVELLIKRDKGPKVAVHLRGARLFAPYMIDIETAHVLRSLAQGKQITDPEAQAALHDFCAMRIERQDHRVLLPRIWELRHNYSAYDASYIAVAERLDAPLVTGDGKLARGTGARCPIELIA